MGKLFGGGGKQTTTSVSEPWKEAQPYLKDIYSEAQNLYQGGAPQFWGGTAQAGLSPEMAAALGGITSRATTGSPLTQAGQDAILAATQGGFAGMNPATDFLTGLLYGGQQNPAAAYAQSLAGGVGTNPAIPYLTREASGANVGKNPYLDATYDQATRALMQKYKETDIPALQSDYALAGRTGSRAYAGALQGAKTSADDQARQLATQIYGGAYSTDRQAQLAAQQALSGAYTSDINARLGAGQFLQGVYDTDLQRQLYGAQQLGQIGQSDISTILNAAQAAPGMAAADYADLDRLMGVGQYTQQRAQAEQDLERQRFDYGQQEPYNWLTQYANLIYGNPGSSSGFGTRTQTTTMPSAGLFGGLLSGALGIGSLVAGAPQIGQGFRSIFG